MNNFIQFARAHVEVAQQHCLNSDPWSNPIKLQNSRCNGVATRPEANFQDNGSKPDLPVRMVVPRITNSVYLLTSRIRQAVPQFSFLGTGAILQAQVIPGTLIDEWSFQTPSIAECRITRIHLTTHPRSENRALS